MLWIILGIVALVYIGASLFLYYLQEKFLFHPEKLPENFQFKFERPFEEMQFEAEDGATIHGLKFTVERPKGIVLYLHGNTRSVKGWSKYAIYFLNYGYEVLMVDYRGFGKSRGKRTEENIKNDLQEVYDRLAEEYGDENIIVYGRSMGSGFAAKVASQNSPLMLILHAPYFSLMDTTKRYLFFIPISVILRYKIKTNVWLRYVRCPIYILHGTRDKLIPYGSSVRLSKIRPDATTLFPIPGANHHNITDFPEYKRAIYDILQV